MKRLSSRAFFLFLLSLCFCSSLISAQEVETTKIGVKIHGEEVKIDLLDITSSHSTRGDCWTILKNNIYDLSKFTHAGGEDKITPICGKGMLTALRAAHQQQYDDQLAQYQLPKSTLQPLVLKEVAKVNPSLASVVQKLLKLKGVAMRAVPRATPPPTNNDVPDAQSPSPRITPRRTIITPPSPIYPRSITITPPPSNRPLNSNGLGDLGDTQPMNNPAPRQQPIVNPYAAFQLGPNPMKDGYIDLAATRIRQAQDDAAANAFRTQQNSFGLFGQAFQRPYIQPPVEPVKTYLNPLQQMQAQQTLFSKPGDFSLPVYGSLAALRGYTAEANIDDALDADKVPQQGTIQKNNNNISAAKKHSRKNRIHRLKQQIVQVNVHVNA